MHQKEALTGSILNLALVISTSARVNIVDQQAATRTCQFLPSCPMCTLKKLNELENEGDEGREAEKHQAVDKESIS
jgi:hypothetical protein